MTTRTRALACWIATALLAAACNPVRDDAVSALGGETGGFGPGPLHRPGQACLLCHDGKLGDPTRFSVAGTVYVSPMSKTAANRATVVLRDADGKAIAYDTNRAGNFYVAPDQYTPRFPLTVEVRYGGETTTMHGLIGREGSCAGCHHDPAGPDSPGHVYVRLEDGGVPP